MLEAVTPRLRTGAKLLSLSIHVNARRHVAPHLSAAQRDYADVQMGSYPYDDNGRYGALLVLRSTQGGRLAEAAAGLRAALDAAGTALGGCR